jgi:hypothetical protein
MIYAVEITVATNSDGDTATHYFATHGFASGTADMPAKTHFAPRLLDPGIFRREMSSGSRLVGQARSSFGELVLANADGALDAWTGYGVYGRAIVLRCSDTGEGAYPAAWSTVFSAVMHSLHATMRDIRIAVRDRTIELQRPICSSTFAGTGDAEGDSNMAGRRKPRCYYEPLYPPGLLVDASRNMFWLHEGSAVDTGVVALDGGASFTMGADYTNLADCLANAPSSGQARIYYGPPVLVRYNAAPAFQAMVDSISALCVHDAVYPAGANLFTEMGISGVTVNGNPVVEGYFDDESTWLQALSAYAMAGPFWFGFNRLGEFDWYEIADPASGTSLATLEARDILAADRLPPSDWAAPLWRVTVLDRQNFSYARTWSTVAPYTSYPGMSREYRDSGVHADATVLDKYPAAQDSTVRVVGNVVGDTLAQDWMTLFGADRALWVVKLKFTAALLALDINDTVTLKLPRYGLSAGAKFLVVAVELNLRAETITFTLWG